MYYYSLSIESRYCPEMIERILRVVRHRGFELCALNVIPFYSTKIVNIYLTVSSRRSVELLVTQLSKLIDVQSIEIQKILSSKNRED
ncbi:acetolactate synthase 2 small subunit [Candidatus Schneideria nysicola]|uniref:acetolactate synthase 2 small subunit n=1 Tax=Candidatus Schneideria nysicola TaxID=1081631 RepID=UPI001CAA77B4|nr:acetolactate synthase 2 small subunit [Candidatus Schneideria nysicola]UAJ65265.1 acetolactate synthase 2 small subunit [Candidatus Schneideria nysicola]UAJ65800.1 acetolactate synthase 2 small subunit [Candidatus Schneideria nysicola]UAJ66327.1 acetolactate synthase 2 small subunit [Candidatus Schneideria nysicola]